MTRAYAPLLEPFGLTYPQYLTMLAMWASDEPPTVGELGERLRLDSGTVTPVLKRLEASGLVERRRDPSDERRVIVSLTEQGDALQDDVADVPTSLFESVGMTIDDGVELRRLLDLFLASIDDDEPTSPA